MITEKTSALDAWRLLGGRSDNGLEVLELNGKSQIYRFDDSTAGSIVAKRLWRANAEHQHLTHELLASALPGSAPRSFGVAPDPDDAWAWLFVEDAGGIPYEPSNEAHRAAVARWLAQLHITFADPGQQSTLPPRGPDVYLEHMRAARARIDECRHKLVRDHRPIVDRATDLITQLEAAWPGIEAMSRDLPPTLVHGDFASKNVRIRGRTGSHQVLAFDWEHSGVGPPAVDLAGAQPDPQRGPQLDVYFRQVSAAWGSARATLDQAVHLGVVLRYAAAFDWEAERLAAGSHDRPTRLLTLYTDRVLSSARWLGLSVAVPN